MGDNLQSNRKKIIKILLIILCILLFYSFALQLKESFNPVGQTLQDLVSMGLLIILPLLLAKKEWHIFPLYFLLVIPLTYFGMWWTHYDDLGPLIFIFYDFVILILVCVSYNFLMFLYKHENSHLVMPILILIIAIVFIYASVGTYRGIISFNRGVVYHNLRCNGNTMTTEQFEKECNKLTTSPYWESYYKDICLQEIENKKNTGRISESFRMDRCRSMKLFPAR